MCLSSLVRRKEPSRKVAFSLCLIKRVEAFLISFCRGASLDGVLLDCRAKLAFSLPVKPQDLE